MEARTIETGAWRRHPEMNRVMYQEIDGVSREHARRQAGCKGRSKCRHWHKRDEEDDARSEQWWCAYVGLRVSVMSLVVLLEGGDAMRDHTMRGVVDERRTSGAEPPRRR